MLKPTLAGLGLLCLSLALYGKARYENLTLPGEHAPYSEEDDTFSTATWRALEPSSSLDDAQVLTALRERKAALGAYEATLEITVPSLVIDAEFDGGEETFRLHAESDTDWFLVHERDPRTFADRDGELLAYATGWDLGAWSSGGVGEGGGALTLPDWLLDAAYLKAVDPVAGEARFAFSMQTQPAAHVEVDVALDTGLINGMAINFSSYVEGTGLEVFTLLVDVSEVTFDVSRDVPRPAESGVVFGPAAPVRVQVVPGV